MTRITSLFMLLPLLFGLAACGESETANPVPETGSQDTLARTDAPAARLNVNTASREELLTIPNVGDRMVGEFEEYRPYVSIRQFREEIGKYVNEDQVAAYEQYLYVPIDRNQSDAETLQQIPGVDPTEAGELAAGRPYASNDAFLEKLGAYVEASQLEEARRYLQAE